MRKYYFIGCLFPEISLKVKPDISFFEMENILDLNLLQKDKEKVKILRKYIDLKNLKRLWIESSIDYKGNLDEKGLDQVCLLEEFFEDFVFDFLKKYENKEDRIKNFSYLLYNFINFHMKRDDFLSFYFKMKRDIKLILLLLRAKELNRDVELEMKFFDKKDFLVKFLLSQKDEKSLDVPKEYARVKEIFLKEKENPKNLHLNLLEFFFEKNREFLEKRPFDIDQVLAYLANLIIVEDFLSLDENQGKIMTDNLL
jgi:hypothetical protein